ncbi:beta-ketoacyl synthase N-terminal-like domain-containing protein [Streptomyces cinerochromogenes]|uniref:beta-ketoacyl synthase N-terminal-like domain-containing protein n=1 Tax=Streptomyces cinerochromogenes TaxID=66422 RepID=UPI00167136BC|nr:beta-ketoacyl synthase N-terminal-like domain-containing protein [Streptomyces cinerochromogenes]GGS57832.1 3-oxoacyl-ACP synthase [Streptomyces cinerochromogenes]
MVSTLTAATPVISAWAAISPWGLDSTDFTTGLSTGKSTAARLDRDVWDTPFDEACLIPDFDIRTVLGRKGTRSMDRATALAVATVGQVLDDGTGNRPPGVGENTGLVLGTSTGSAQSMMSFTRDSLVGERPYLVDPARFPNTVMNCAAGQSAIWHRLKGPNTTLAGGRATGLLALRYALRLQRAGRAETLLCGAVEEFSPARAWLDWHVRGQGEQAGVLGEGAAVWLLERADAAGASGRRPLAAPLGLEFGFARDTEQIRPVLADCLRRLLGRAGAEPGEVRTIAVSGAEGDQGEAERAALTDVFGAADGRGPDCATLIGDTYAASAAFQIAAVLALAETGTESLALVTSVEANGVVGAALLATQG